ncbi:olfactory receptor 5V1-like [Ranitomeya imitator]|uniref:olfactory receptor 5V1-like n=1 Tax=Ranitomeya imitator TaxID=111125 RepID=UPI0037E8B74E
METTEIPSTDENGGNRTCANALVILGFSYYCGYKLIFITLFSVAYLQIIMANMLIISLGCSCRHLRKPMFFFLMNMSAADICFISVTMPWIIISILLNIRAVTLTVCAIQMYCFLAFTSSEFLLLSAMAYDRYVAICDPLHYNLIMNKRFCAVFAAGCWLLGFMDTFPHAWFILRACYCKSKRLNHFFCDLTALLKMSCSETQSIERITYVEGAFLGFGPFLLTLTSYVFIINSILKIQSTEGRSKALSTCSSHLIIVVIFYGTTLSMYMRPTSTFSLEINKIITLIYVIIIPLLNPIIYSLRNRELRQAFKMVFHVDIFLKK